MSHDNTSKPAEAYFYQWFADNILGGCYSEISIKDISLFFHIHKQILLTFLSSFTNQGSQAIAIACEIENYFAKAEYSLLDVHEKVQLEEMIKREHLLREAQEIAHVGSWEWHIPTGEITFSDEMFHIFGLSPGEITIDPESYIGLIHPNDKEKATAILHHCAATGEPFAFEHQVVYRDGSIRWVLCKGKAIINSDNKVERLVGASIDLTEQKQVEKQLLETNQAMVEKKAQLRKLNENLEQLVERRTEELRIAVEKIKQLLEREKVARFEADSGRKQMERLFMQAPVALGIFNGPEHRIELANQALCDIWGKTREEVLGKPLFEALSEVKNQVFEGLLNKVLTTGEPFIGNEIYGKITRRGKLDEAYLNFVYQPVSNADGQITGIITVAHEVTKEVMARKKVEESEARVLRILESMPQIGWTADAEGKVTYLNQQWYEFSGVDLTNFLPQDPSSIIHPEDIGHIREQWSQSMVTGEPLQAEYRLRRWDGEYHYL